MEQLKRNEYGQFDDNRAIEIGEDFKEALSPLLEKWRNVDSMDIENIIFHTLPYLMTKRTLRYVNTQKVKEETTENDYRIFMVKDGRDWIEPHIVVLIDFGERVKEFLDGDMIACRVAIEDLDNNDSYYVEFSNDIEDEYIEVSEDIRAVVIKVVKDFLSENPIDSIRYDEILR